MALLADENPRNILEPLVWGRPHPRNNRDSLRRVFYPGKFPQSSASRVSCFLHLASDGVALDDSSLFIANQNKLVKKTHRTLISFLLILGVFNSMNSLAKSETEALSISGHYIHVFSNGAPPKTNTFAFHALITANGFAISMTNVNQPKEWGTIQSDGTNIFTVSADLMNPGKTYGYAYPGLFFLPEGQNAPYFFFPWMFFGLKPEMTQHYDKGGMTDLPAPWGKRYSLLDYGFQWNISYFSNQNVIQKINTKIANIWMKVPYDR